MRIGDLLHEEVIRVDLRARTKAEAIEELVDVLVEAHEIPLSLRDHVLEVVNERERQHSTGMEHGVAIPHGSSERIEDIIGVVGISRQGIPFESLDGIAAKIVVLLVLPRRSFRGTAQTMAGIAHLLRSPDMRKRLREAPSAEAMLRIIKEEEERDSFYNVRAQL